MLALVAAGAGACVSGSPPLEAPPVAQTQTAITREEAVAALATARAQIERRDYAAARGGLTRVVGDADRWGWYDVASDAHFMLGEVLERERGAPDDPERERAARDAADAYTRAYDASRRLGDRPRGVRDLNALTNALLDARAHQKASEAASEALRLAERERDLIAQATAQNNLAEADRMAGRLDAARDGYARALALARQAGDRVTQASILLNLGASERRAGRLDVARAHFTEARELAGELNDARAGAYADWNIQQIDVEIRAREGRR